MASSKKKKKQQKIMTKKIKIFFYLFFFKPNHNNCRLFINICSQLDYNFKHAFGAQLSYYHNFIGGFAKFGGGVCVCVWIILKKQFFIIQLHRKKIYTIGLAI